MRFIDLTGQVFGHLTVISRAPNKGTKGKETAWFVQCSCGIRLAVGAGKLRNGHTAGCGRHRTRLLDPVAEKARVKSLRDLHRTRPEPLLNALYQKERERSRQVGFPVPDYSWPEFRDHWINHPDFLRRYAEWKSSGFKNRWLRPSVDRINPTKPYTFENTHMLNWGENRFKLNMEGRRLGRKRHLKVVQLKDGVVVAEYPTQIEAVRKTGLVQGQISAVIRGRFKSTGGFQFEYRPRKGGLTS